MFDVTLGDWDTDTVDLELNPDYKPFNCKYYLVPRINKESFRKELERLVKIGVLTMVQKSEYITPVFTIPNKEGTVSFIMDYLRINQELSRKTYQLPRIGETIPHM